MEIDNHASVPAIVEPPTRTAKFAIGQVVKHRVYPFRGVIFDVDPVFANTEEWLASIPAEVRPRRDQPFYHLLAENSQTTYVAYVSEQNLLPGRNRQAGIASAGSAFLQGTEARPLRLTRPSAALIGRQLADL